MQTLTQPLEIEQKQRNDPGSKKFADQKGYVF
jgi:hypothetical protein